MQDFRNLKVWHKAHALTLRIYQITEEFPASEKYGLVSQMRRASQSIPTNFAEGCGRGGSKELARFAQIAMGSAAELEYQLLLAYNLGFILKDVYRPLEQDVVEIKRMLTGFIKTLQQ